PLDLSIPAYQNDDEVISAILTVEEAECMASLAASLKQRSVRADAADEAAQGAKSGFRYRVKPGSTSIMEVMKLAEKKKSGEDLTAEEESILATNQEQISKALSSIDMSGLVGSFIKPETRTEERYREEVSEYLTAYAEFLNDHLWHEYCKRELGL